MRIFQVEAGSVLRSGRFPSYVSAKASARKRHEWAVSQDANNALATMHAELHPPSQNPKKWS